MSLTHDQAGHLLHPAMWTIDGNPALVLTTDWDEDSDTFGMPVVENWNYYGRANRYAWLSVASVYDDLGPGVGGLFKMGDGARTAPMTWWGFQYDVSSSTPTLSFVDMSTNGNLGGVNGAPPYLYTGQQFEFERLYGDYRYVIRVVGSSWCLTAGASPSATPVAGAVTLTEYEGAANQIWSCNGSPDLIGFYDIRSYASNGSLVVTTPGDVSSDLVQLGLASPRPESASQAYRLIEPSLDPSQAPRKILAHQARSPRLTFNLGRAQTGVWTVYSINQLATDWDRRSALNAPETSNMSWNAGGISYPALHLSFLNYPWDTAGPERVPFSGGLWGADDYPESPHQHWIPVPRNVFDASLPTPSTLSVVLDNEYSHITTETTSRCALDIREGGSSTTASCQLKFSVSGDCDQFQVAAETRSMHDDGTWGDWQLERSSELFDTTSIEPGWPVVWIPNAFAGNPDTDGRVAIDVERVMLFDSDHRIQRRYRVRAFRYSESGVPIVGPAASITIDVSARNKFELNGSPMVMRDGLQIPYNIRYYTGPTSIHFDSVRLGDVDAIVDYDTSTSSSSGTLLVPWTAFRELDSTWPTTAGRAIELTGRTNDLFGDSEFELSGTLVADPYARHEQGYAREHDLFTSVSAFAGTELRTLCVVDSEDAQHVIDMPPSIVTPPAQDQAKILDGEAQTTSHVVSISQVSPLDPDYYAIAGFQILRPVRGITTLAFQRGGDTVIIPIEGNVSASFSLTRDFSTARRVGDRAFSIGTLPGASPELELSGTLYRNQLSSRDSQGSGVVIASTIQEACRIPVDATCVLRTAYGTCHRVRVVGVSAPRSARDQAEITFSLVEVDD